MVKFAGFVLNYVMSIILALAGLDLLLLYLVGFLIPFFSEYTIADLSPNMKYILLNPFILLISFLCIMICVFYCGKASAKEEVEINKKKANDEIDQNIRTMSEIIEINKAILNASPAALAKRIVDNIKTEKGL